MRFPRYVPELGWPPEGQVLVPPQGPRHATPFARAREALAAYFDEVPRGRVLLSAQICPAVPFLLRERGFDLAFADVDALDPCPGPEQVEPALTRDTVAVVLSPMYGQAPDWPEWNGPRLVLDLAQGIGQLRPLWPSADAIVYSFGLGKGADLGGGLLLTQAPLERKTFPSAGYGPILKTILQAVALRALQLTNLEGLVLDRAVESDKEARAVRPTRVPERVVPWWEGRAARFLKQAQLARERCLTLPGSSWRGLPLRTLLKGDAELLRRLRQAGVDALPAGEPLPGEYLQGISGSFPNARRFREETLRLPFLGRMSEARFRRFLQVVEDCLAQRL